MLSALLRMSGFLILRLIYGKEKAETMSESLTLPMVLSLLFIFWLLCLLFLFSGTAANDFWLCLVYVIGYPVAILIWSILARRENNKNI